MTIQNARDHFGGMMAKERRDHVEGERMVQLMTDRSLRAEYKDKVNAVIDAFEANPKRFNKKIDMNI
jgi:hypothetical protein